MNIVLRTQIEMYMQEGKYSDAYACLKEYKDRNPYDRDGWFLECVYCIGTHDYEGALRIARVCVRNFPTSYEAYYYLGSIYQEMGMVPEALKAYKISYFLADYVQCSQEEIMQDIRTQMEILEQRYAEQIDHYIAVNDTEKMRQASAFMQRMETVWGKNEKYPRSTKALIVGTQYWVADDDLRFIGIYRSPVQGFIGDENMSLVRVQGEFLKFSLRKEYCVEGDAQEYLLPIASATEDNEYVFVQDNVHYGIVQRVTKHFNYYRVKNHTKVYSKETSYYSTPIPLGHRPERRKLVLSFFVDGLAQEVINGSDFAKLMPNTYAFFSKGTVCTQAYSCSEWTFPSLATYESGLNTLSHMMFHNEIDGELPKDIPTLSEYFKRQGYYTSKLDGDWRCIYSYGFARGVDQYVYQIQSMGARAEHEIVNVIEHLEAFQDTDQYLWMTVGDLHDVADGLDLSQAVQNRLDLGMRTYEDIGTTSVKQAYSANKSAMYKQNVRYLDMLFGLLYQYIESHYEDDEILISLFADHGQGYLVPDDGQFLSKERTKVAFMFRGAGVPAQTTDEIISTADYVPIMCRLAGIEPDPVPIDGNLPRAFGGMTERIYTITECLHPGDCYQAVANTRMYEIYFENTEPTDEEGRFRLGDYKVFGYDRAGVPVTDQSVLNEYEKIFLDRIRTHIIYEG